MSVNSQPCAAHAISLAGIPADTTTRIATEMRAVSDRRVRIVLSGKSRGIAPIPRDASIAIEINQVNQELR